jgi:hypothetical protein
VSRACIVVKGVDVVAIAAIAAAVEGWQGQLVVVAIILEARRRLPVLS